MISVYIRYSHFQELQNATCTPTDFVKIGTGLVMQTPSGTINNDCYQSSEFWLYDSLSTSTVFVHHIKATADGVRHAP